MRSSTIENRIPTQSADEELHVASFVAQVRPERLEALSQWLLEQPGVEIHASDPQGKLVVVIEREHMREIPEFIETVKEEAGVIDAALVYHEVVSSEEHTT